jgi:predicted nucleic acid-binding protein
LPSRLLPRRVWCACTIVDYLEGTARARDCELIAEQAKRRELEIVVSTISMGEVAKINGLTDADAELKIRQFFEEYWVVPVAFDITVAEKVRELIRKYGPGLKACDAIHAATALQYGISLLETFDQPMINRLSGKEGNPPLELRFPKYDGPPPSAQRSLLPAE